MQSTTGIKDISTKNNSTKLFNQKKRASIIHLSEEWDAKKDFTEKNINKLLLEYPDVFKRVEVKRKDKYPKGVGLIVDSTEVKNEGSDS